MQNTDQLDTHRHRGCSSAATATDHVPRVVARVSNGPDGKDEMEPFRVDVPDEVLDDLQTRLKLTRWTDDFANEDRQYGTNTAYLKELVAYWIEGYDWRKQERAINAYPQFLTNVDGVPIHFIHVRGKGPHPKPLILSHGWPWTFWEYRKVIDPLSDPGAHGGDTADAFDVVVPSLPGYGFSTPLRKPGINFW